VPCYGLCSTEVLFTDIDYADEAVLFAEDDVQWPSILESFDTAANTMGLHTSWVKTKIQNVASGPWPPSCVISGHQVETEVVEVVNNLQNSKVGHRTIISSFEFWPMFVRAIFYSLYSVCVLNLKYVFLTVHTYTHALSLYAWPSTGRSALHADRSVAKLQASEGEPCARGDLLHLLFS